MALGITAAVGCRSRAAETARLCSHNKGSKAMLKLVIIALAVTITSAASAMPLLPLLSEPTVMAVGCDVGQLLFNGHCQSRRDEYRRERHREERGDRRHERRDFRYDRREDRRDRDRLDD
jgi:hypothetical protein